MLALPYILRYTVDRKDECVGGRMFIEFYNKVFNINLSDYENIGLNFPINKVLFAITVVICAACIFVELQRKYTKDLVCQLIRHEASGEDSAKTLEELGLDSSFFVKRIIGSETSFVSRLVKRVGKVEYTYEEYIALQKEKKLEREVIDFTTARFYLDSKQENRKKHIIENYNTSIVRTVMLCVMMLAIYICIALLIPEILSAINGAL